MEHKRKNKQPKLTSHITVILLLMIGQLCITGVFAQETKTATISLTFDRTDSTKTCNALVVADNKPVKDKEVHLYVKGMYSLLAIGKVATTDSAGTASFNFPMNLPGDQNGMITLIAKIEKDETYGNVETQSMVKWGALATNESYNWGHRSLSASREKAPMFLVIASIGIILGIWGTILYLFFQLFQIKRSGKLIKKITGTPV